MSGEGELAGRGGVACGRGGRPEGLTKPPLLSLISARAEIIRRSEAAESGGNRG